MAWCKSCVLLFFCGLKCANLHLILINHFQYCGPSAPATEGRVPAYTDNLNSWLGQILQRDAPHIPVEIVDVETTGYVLRLCPFEDVAMVGLSADDVESFLQVRISHFEYA